MDDDSINPSEQVSANLYAGSDHCLGGLHYTKDNIVFILWKRIFERTIFGMYLGGIVTRVLVNMVEAADLFGEHASSKLSTPLYLLIEFLYVRAPTPDVKLKLLKDIADEHELDEDLAASEAELLKPREDLLDGPTQFISGTKVPPPEENDDDDTEDSARDTSLITHLTQMHALTHLISLKSQKTSLRPRTGTAPKMLPSPASALSGPDIESPNSSNDEEPYPHDLKTELEEMLQQKSESKDFKPPDTLVGEDKKFLPFISPTHS